MPRRRKRTFRQRRHLTRSQRAHPLAQFAKAEHLERNEMRRAAIKTVRRKTSARAIERLKPHDT